MSEDEGKRGHPDSPFREVLENQQRHGQTHTQFTPGVSQGQGWTWSQPVGYRGRQGSTWRQGSTQRQTRSCRQQTVPKPELQRGRTLTRM